MQSVTLDVEIFIGNALRQIAMEQHATLSANRANFPNGLYRTYLVVRAHDGNEDGIG
ncbi:hypothetical protein GCM10008942_31810 [Rhizomicrobium electricum]|uniref:Uncharacterized protein n=1 Tax=Rhizomicrobium electricum TaxID=480070 RepID=A0ABP3Q7K8_9PROT